MFSTFEIWIIFLQTRMDSLQEACEACFTMDAHTLFDVLWTVEEKHPTHCNDNAWNSQDNF